MLPIRSIPGTFRSRTSPSTLSTTTSLILSFSRLSLPPCNQTLLQSRSASHASQGRANRAAPGPGKRLGAKKSDSEPVVPGNIIFRQRGSLWFPGENCVMGRDHTISALAKGFVRYYRDPDRHPKRKYIGVVFEQNEMLPRGPNAARRRRLGMDAVTVQPTVLEDGEVFEAGVLQSEADQSLLQSVAKDAPQGRTSALTLKDGYQYRESNTSIGRTAERAGVQVLPYRPGNRWLAWRKTEKRKERAAEKRSLRRKK